MTSFSLLSLLLTLSALFGVINSRTLRLPNTIGVLVIAMLVSLVVLAADPLIPHHDLHAMARDLLGSVDLPRALMNGALSFLLFAGALQVDLGHLWQRKLPVAALALFGTTVAVALYAGAMWLIFPLLGQPVPLGWCVVLGAVLAPTDPVSVVGMLRRIGLPAPLQAIFAGESLFNDGVGVVIFGVALAVATGDGGAVSGSEILSRFLLEAVGGLLLGLVLGWLALLVMRLVDDAHVELIVTLALAAGTFSLADALHMSGPIGVVTAGLALGTKRSRTVISDHGRHELNTFWSLIDEVLNALLFLLIGLEVVAVPLHRATLLAAAVAIPLAVMVRGLSVVIASSAVYLHGTFRRERLRAMVLLTWGGLRGGISVALALGLPESPVRNTLLTVCYGVVVFTIIVQGLTMEGLARRLYPRVEDAPA